MMLFAFAGLFALTVIVATLRPEADRIVRLLRHGPMIGAVEMAAIRTVPGRRITLRQAGPSSLAGPRIWREAA
ncbi:hypothetical protein [Sphingomonas japonica]|nr:hypothetical protein [Sphingomonas japonica]